MPCWYFDKREIRNSPSLHNHIEGPVESRYRREGARFIMDAGTKMGLRFDTNATGVVYFHRFYMFHSFKAFPRYVTAACCLFLAGKVEETPKKCKDIIKISQSLLTPQQFAAFGSDPKEEVMTLERVLLQTIKFDLQVEHPYGILLKYAKFLKGDKEQIQKMVQMAWTFVNDSMCTTLCLQWEPEIISVSLMYLASRLSKFDIQDWDGKPNIPGCRKKWWECFIEDMSMELMEDICHQVLDLYSNKGKTIEDSPPPSPPPKEDSVTRTPGSRSGSATPVKKPVKKMTKMDNQRGHHTKDVKKPVKVDSKQHKIEPIRTLKRRAEPVPEKDSEVPQPPPASAPNIPPAAGPPSAQTPVSEPGTGDQYTMFNPYVSTGMYTSSFMSQEGSQNIQTLLTGGPPPPAAANQYPQYPQPPPAGNPAYPPAGYQQGGYGQPPPSSYPQPNYPPVSSVAYNGSYQVPPSYSSPMPAYPNAPPQGQPPGYQPQSYPPYQQYPPPPMVQGQFAPGQAPPGPMGDPRQPMPAGQNYNAGPRVPWTQTASQTSSTGLAQVRITGTSGRR
ncbi:cyclin-K-like isoform X2 [Gigantopelta aegis]|uniref:cyclin-K-like isoform X2 n=1 Tax=Gigantopelta aegis TaxID=1735272 RepID=UPI001B88E678|nr:cyclin-K-like isoform X2 [Gigantopelta aegis]